MQDKITLTSHCFLHAIAMRVFVHPPKELGSQCHIFILSVLLPSTNLPIDAPLCPRHPLNEAPVFPIPPVSLTQTQLPRSHGERGDKGLGKLFFPLQKDALLVLERGQRWTWCCEASIAPGAFTGTPKKRGGIIEWGEKGGRGRGSPETAPSVLRDITQRRIKSDRAEEIQHG